MGPVIPLAPQDLAQRLGAGEDLVLVDVRESAELAICAITGAQHLPLGELPHRLEELDPSRPVVCICHHGIRSQHAAHFLAQNGFERLYNLTGGVDRWAEEVDADMARY